MISRLHPQRIIDTLDAIDDEKPSYTLSRKAGTRRVFAVLACVSVCLLMIHYLKYYTSFYAALGMLSNMLGENTNYALEAIQSTGFLRLISYTWWTSWHVIGYVIIPFFFVKYVLKIGFVDLGWKWNDTSKHWFGYVLLLSPILLGIFLVSFRSDFLNHYPFYKLSNRSWFDFIAWECLYLTQFICLEFFFRGFFINTLRPAIGANAIWVMCVPYMMIHLPKLWIEASGAILFGLFLGLLALRSRSIWGGFLVHAGVAVTMDLASLLRQGKLPSVMFPTF